MWLNYYSKVARLPDTAGGEFRASILYMDKCYIITKNRVQNTMPAVAGNDAEYYTTVDSPKLIITIN